MSYILSLKSELVNIFFIFWSPIHPLSLCTKMSDEICWSRLYIWWWIPDHPAQPPALQTPEPVDQKLVVTITQVCHILQQDIMILTRQSKYFKLLNEHKKVKKSCRKQVVWTFLKHVSEHRVGWLCREDWVLEKDQQRPDVVLPEILMDYKFWKMISESWHYL